MKRSLRFLAALLLVVGLHTLASRLMPWFSSTVDMFLILAIFSSLGRSPAWSCLAGTVTGLAADSLSGGLFGLYGFANTLTAWGAAQVQQRIVLHQPVTVGLLMSAATAVQMTTLAVLFSLLLLGSEGPSPGFMLLRMLTSGILGAVLFVTIRRFERFEKKWRERRGRRLRIES